MANRVFDDRLGILVISSGNLTSRLPAMARYGIIDVMLPRTAAPTDVALVRGAGLFAHLWSASDGLSARDYANRVLLDVGRFGARGYELNIEHPPDPQLAAYVRETIATIRSKRPNLRLCVNVAAWKGLAFEGISWAADSYLFARVQAFEGGNMDAVLSAADVLHDLHAWGVPVDRATACYAAHSFVWGSSERLRVLPDLRRLHRGTIFSDDLMHDAGLLP